MSNGYTYDLTILGATGYTGKLVLAYLDTLNTSKSICLGARDVKAAAKLKEKFKISATIEYADVTDEASIYLLVGKSRVVLSCVGPYELYGEVVIKACVSLGSHYVDITGEGQWIERMRAKYDDVAKRNDVILIPFAGQDCVPADLTAWFTMTQISKKELEESHAALQTFVKLPNGGGISNGTWNTMLGWAQAGQMIATSREIKPLSNTKLQDDAVVLVPEIPESMGGPFACLTTRMMPDPDVVFASEDSSKKFKAGVFENVHGFVVPNRAAGYIAKFGIKALPYLVRIPFVLRALQSLTTSGEAMSLGAKASMEYSTFGVLKVFPLRGGGNHAVETIVTRVICDRDPYEVTAVTCTQIALALLDEDIVANALRAPLNSGKGFQTPVSAIGGQELLERCFECVRVELVARL